MFAKWYESLSRAAPQSWEGETYLGFNPMSQAWKPQGNVSCCCKVVYYTPGMIGYASALPTRLIGLIKDLLMLIKAILLPCFNEDKELGYRAKAVAGSFAEIGIAIIGTICPPVAYRMDESLARTAQEHGFLKYCETTLTGKLHSLTEEQGE